MKRIVDLLLAISLGFLIILMLLTLIFKIDTRILTVAVPLVFLMNFVQRLNVMHKYYKKRQYLSAGSNYFDMGVISFFLLSSIAMYFLPVEFDLMFLFIWFVVLFPLYWFKSLIDLRQFRNRFNADNMDKIVELQILKRDNQWMDRENKMIRSMGGKVHE
jgi:4-hydroxybenzoate polyprenyltransferase